MKNDVLKQFWSLYNEAKVTLETVLDTKKHEPFLLRILSYVKANEEFKNEFIDSFIHIIQDPEGTLEVVMYSMRELKWKEVYDATLKEYTDSNDIRTKAVLEDVLDVFEDEWDGSDLYDYYA
jgi:hypothetical protein